MRGVIGLSVAANVAAGVNRKATGVDRKTAGVDRKTAGIDRKTTNVNRKTTSVNRKTAGPTADCGAGGCTQSPPPLADARQ